MKKNYETAILECIVLAEEDVLTASDGNGFDTPYDAF